MATAYLLLGTNLGNKMLHLYSARIQIQKKLGNIKKTSSVYESKSWGYDSIHTYYNQALMIETNHSPQALLTGIKSIEKHMGRIKQSESNYEDRVIDIDIIFYENMVLNDLHLGLQIPHPRFQERLFAIYPIREIIDPKYSHPLSQMSISEIVSSVSGEAPHPIK